MKSQSFKKVLPMAFALIIGKAQAAPTTYMWDKRAAQLKTTIIPVANENWRARISYRVLEDHDIKMLTVIDYCSQPGHCRTDAEADYLQKFLTRENYNPNREMWETGLNAFKTATDVGKNLGPIGETLGSFMGPVTDIYMKHPELFDYSFKYWSKGLALSSFGDVDLNASLGLIYNDPVVREIFDKITKKAYRGESSDDYTESPGIILLKRTYNIDERTESAQQATKELQVRMASLLQADKENESRRLSAEEHAKKIADFEQTEREVSAAFSILADVVGVKDPKTARVISGVGNASMKVMETVKMARGLTELQPSKLIMMSNLVSAALIVVQATQDDAQQKFQEAVMAEFNVIHEQLKEISEQLNQLSGAVNFGFTQVLEDLQRLKQMQQMSGADLLNLKARLVVAESNIRDYMQSDRMSEWMGQSFDCLDSANVRGVQDSEASIRERAVHCFNTFRNVTVLHAYDDLWSDNAPRFESSDSITKINNVEFGRKNNLNDLNYLLQMIHRTKIVEGDALPERLPNFELWNFAANTFADINLHYFSLLQPKVSILNEVGESGRNIQRFFDRTVGSKDFELRFAEVLQSKYDALIREIQKSTVDLLASTQDMHLPEKPAGKVRSEREDANMPKTMPTDLRAAIPAQWFLAEKLGLGHLDMSYGWRPSSAGKMLQFIHHLAYRIEVVVHVNFIRNDNSIMPVFAKSRISQYYGLPILLDRVPGCDEKMWERGEGINFDGSQTHEEPLYQNFVKNSIPWGNQAPMAKAFQTIDQEVRTILKNSILAAMPHLNPQTGAFESLVPGSTALGLTSVRDAYYDLVETFKTFEALSVASSYYTQGFSENCMKAVERMDPNQFIEQFSKQQDVLSAIQSDAAQPKRLLLYKHRRSQDLHSRCYQPKPVVEFIARTNAKFAILENLAQPLSAAPKDINSSCKGVSGWFKTSCW